MPAGIGQLLSMFSALCALESIVIKHNTNTQYTQYTLTFTISNDLIEISADLHSQIEEIRLIFNDPC